MKADFNLAEALEQGQENLEQLKPTSDFALTQLGLAERFAAQHGGDVRCCQSLGWLVWDGKRWAPDANGEVKQKAKQTVRTIYVEAALAGDEKRRKELASFAKSSESRHNILAMIELAKSEPPIPIVPEVFDTDPMLLNVENGTLDLTLGQLRPHNRDDYITRLAPIEHNPQPDCPAWEVFLNKIMNGNSHLINFLQRMVGYCLTASTNEHSLFVLYGKGQNGKTTFLEALRSVLGNYSQAAPFSTFLIQKGSDRIPNDIARLRGARLVCATEGEENRCLAEAMIKQLTGGDTITARFLHKEFFEFRPSFKILLGTNHKPGIRGTDLAIWRRIKLIPFTVTIPENQQDKNLVAKLRNEASGILKWALEGCLEWQRVGLGVPVEVKEATQGYRREEDVLGHFLTDCCVIGEGHKITAKELFKKYKEWCQESTEKPVSQKVFGGQLTERDFVRKRGRAGVHLWHGLRLLKDDENIGDGLPIGTHNSGFFIYETDKEENTEKEASVTPNGSPLTGCDFYRTTGDCRAAHEIKLMALPVKPGLEGLGCRSFQTSGRCPAADGIEALMAAGG